MSGPPPCTTTGFIPTYFSSTMSRAKSSTSAGSVIAAPPYLMTTVRPWNSRMYGSASRRVPTSLMPAASSCRVFGVDGDVAVAEVGEEDLGLGAVAGKADLVLDLRAGRGGAERLRVVRHSRTGAADRDPLDVDVELKRRRERHRHPDGLRDP